jgi:hypothetical protein
MYGLETRRRVGGGKNCDEETIKQGGRQEVSKVRTYDAC